MNSIIKINGNATVDIMIVRAITYSAQESTMYIFFMRHDQPLEVMCSYDDYLNFYTKWRNYAEWRLQLMMGDDNND